MIRQVKKWITFVMAFALMVGSINYGSLFVNATAEGEDAAGYAESDDASVSGGDFVSGSASVSGGDIVSNDSVSGDDLGITEDTIGDSVIFDDILMAAMSGIQFFSSADDIAVVSDEVTTRYYTFNDIAKAGGYGHVEAVNAAGALDILYNGQYQEIQYSFPEGVDVTTIEKITFKVSEGDTNNLTIKILKPGDDGAKQIQATDGNTITVAENLTGEESIFFGLMNRAASQQFFVIDYFSITAKQSGGAEEPPAPGKATTRYYTFNDVTKTDGYGNTFNVSAAGALDISYSGQNMEIQYSLPEGVDAATIEMITFMVSEGDVSKLAIKILKDGSQAQVVYGQKAIAVKADQLGAGNIGFALMNTAESAQSFVIDSFSITAEHAERAETENITPAKTSDADKRYTITDGGLTALSSDNVTCTPQDIEKVLLSFSSSADYPQINFALPEPIDLAYAKSVTFAISNQTVPLTFKIFNEEGFSYNSYNGVKVEYSKTGSYTMDLSNLADEGSITHVGIMLSKSDKTDVNTCLFDGVLFQMNDPNQELDPTENITPAKTGDADKRYTITDGGLAVDAGSINGVTYTPQDIEKVSLSFSGAWAQINFALPEPIDLAYAKSVTFAISDQTVPLTFKIFNEKGFDYNGYNGIKAEYSKTGSYTMDLSGLADEGSITHVSIALHGNDVKDVNTCLLDGVLFKMNDPNQEIGPTENTTPAKTGDADKRYTITDGGLTVDVDSINGVTYNPQEVEKVSLSFSGEWTQINFALPEPIDLAYAKSVTFAISDQTVPLTFKIFNEKGFDYNGYNGIKAEYSKTGSYTMDLSGLADEGSITHVAIALNSSDVKDVNTCLFDGVLFKMNDPNQEPDPTHTLTYTMDQIELGTSNAASCDKINDNYVITFAELNQQVSLKLPAIINGGNCINMQVVVSGQTGPVNYYWDYDGAQKGVKYYLPPNDKGIHTVEIPEKEEAYGIDGIRIQCGGEEYTPNSGITIEKIIFTMKGEDGTNDFLKEDEADPEPPRVEVDPGVVNVTPETAATPGCEPERILAGDLKVAGENSVEWKKTTADQIQITFEKEWAELKLKLPNEVNLLQCTGVTFALSEQTVPMSFKLYNENTEIVGWYKHEMNEDMRYTYSVSSTEKVTHIGIMLHAEDMKKERAAAAYYCVFDGVVFDMNRSLSAESYTVVYPAGQLTLQSSEASSCKLENDNWMIRFSDMDQKVNFSFPESVNMEKCISIIVTVATQNGPVNFFMNADNVQKGDPYYYNNNSTTYALAPSTTSKINGFTIQCGRENDAYVDGAFVELVSVAFEMRGAAPGEAPADNDYPIGSLYKESAVGATAQIAENGAADITFPKKDDSITYEVPDPVDVNHMTSMEFKPSLSGVKVQALNANGKVLMEGTGSVLATNCHSDIKYIRLVSLADNTTLHLDSIKFNVDPNAFEAIVLNGKFDREDISVWGSALWGDVTITPKTSDTEIGAGTGVYTYGEISRRNSPYNSFAQDVTARTTPGKGYAFSFWVKLSDDYKDAPANMRTVEFAPYYKDSSMKDVYNMDIVGDYKKALVPGEWVQFSGTVGLPANARGFVIRIVEQGTNYGQGQCVMGSYAVTNVVMYETDYPVVWRGNGGGGGGSSRSNVVTREANFVLPYTMSDLSIDWASASTEKDGDKLRLGFTNNYDEVRLKLPRTLDMSTCAYVQLNMPEQNVPIAIKLYWKGQQVDVDYYNDIKSLYTLVPAYSGMIDAIGIMSLATPNPTGAYALADSVVFGLTEEPAPEPVYNTIVINGDFADEDMGDWSEALWGDGVTITRHTADKPIFGNTYTYATYSRRTSPYQCFAQDITARVKQNETYKFSFWAKLSNDYKNAPENQRVVQFAPYTVDKNGNADYNPRLEGNYVQVLEPGKWTYFEGTYKVTNSNPISKVVIRILEQGTNYGQGDCVMGSYSVAGVHMEKYIPEPPEIDEDVPNLKDVTREVFGDDFIMGTAVSLEEMEDIGIEMLVNKHFNAVTLGNALKPDALFNYSNDQHTKLQTITFNGQKLEVPTLYFDRAEEILDMLKKWNEGHPEDPIRVRGHVLVWHSQTPEWFFREGYTVKQNADGSENYVTPEVMNLRLEWFIKTVLEHFTGEDSPYKDMFYGWDVVNEAVHNTGYRTDKLAVSEPLSQSTHSYNSSWWAVYQSNEFIINAFRFANMYAPADVELYYNDFNEADSAKMKGIVKLLEDVKGAEGTRIDAMGMQGHYNVNSPKLKDIEAAIRAYAGVVGKVMITEFDLKASGDISNEQNRQREYLLQAERYHDIYLLLQKLDAEEGIDIGGFIVWGTVDKYSWLQGGSELGGGSDGTLSHCPLLFDSDYRVKPAYWALVDYTMVDPDWVEEDAAENVNPEPEPADAPGTPDAPAEGDTAPESEQEAVPVADTNPVVKEKKNNPIVLIAVIAGVLIAGVGAGTGFYLSKKKKK